MFRGLALDGRHQTPDGDNRRIHSLIGTQCGNRSIGQLGQELLDAVQRMIRHIQPEHLALMCEQDRLLPFSEGDLLLRDERLPRVRQAAEEIELAHRFGALDVDRSLDDLLMDLEQPFAGVTEGIEGTRLDQ